MVKIVVVIADSRTANAIHRAKIPHRVTGARWNEERID
jgi:hypothetical protein